VTVIGIAWSGTAKEMQGFVDAHHITFPTLNDADSSLFAHFGVPAQPAWVFVRADGSAKRVLGAEEPDVLARNLDALAVS
jgi:peroxiredoxin